MTKFSIKRLIGKTQNQANKLAEVFSLCGTDVISVRNRADKAFFIRTNTGWILMGSHGFGEGEEVMIRLAEDAIGEEIASKVKAVIFSRPSVDWKEGVRPFLKDRQEELTVYAPDNGTETEETVEGVAYYTITKSGTIWIDGLTFGFVVEAKADTEVGFYLPKYKVFQPGETYESGVRLVADKVENVPFSTEGLLAEIKEEIAANQKEQDPETFLLEVADGGQISAYAIKLEENALHYVEVEEELADYFWDAEIPVAQISKSQLRQLYIQQKGNGQLYQALLNFIKATDLEVKVAG